jgi:hypothetical protein
MDVNEMGRSNWPVQKFECPDCKQRDMKRIPPHIPPELGKVVVCMACLRKVLWWNDRWWRIEPLNSSSVISFSSGLFSSPQIKEVGDE